MTTRKTTNSKYESDVHIMLNLMLSAIIGDKVNKSILEKTAVVELLEKLHSDNLNKSLKSILFLLIIFEMLETFKITDLDNLIQKLLTSASFRRNTRG